jgi:hypothetical protein
MIKDSSSPMAFEQRHGRRLSRDRASSNSRSRIFAAAAMKRRTPTLIFAVDVAHCEMKGRTNDHLLLQCHLLDKNGMAGMLGIKLASDDQANVDESGSQT